MKSLKKKNVVTRPEKLSFFCLASSQSSQNGFWVLQGYKIFMITGKVYKINTLTIPLV
jgi:hypothetical protein